MVLDHPPRGLSWHPHHGRLRQPRYFCTGFTLIELMVVIVIIGVVISVASLSLGVLGRDHDLEEQAKRLHAIIGEVREESELQGKDVGLLIERDGYQFMRYSWQQGRWQPMNDDELSQHRQLTDGIQLRLWLEGREVVLKTHEENRFLSASSSSSSSSSANGATDLGGPNTNKSSTTRDELVPQIALLSSGDVSPFELQIQRDNNPTIWKLTGKADSTIEIELLPQEGAP